MIRVNRHQMSVRRSWDPNFSPTRSASRIIRQAMGVNIDRPVSQRDYSEVERASTHALVGLATTDDLRTFARNWLPAVTWCCRQMAQHHDRVPSPGKQGFVIKMIGNLKPGVAGEEERDQRLAESLTYSMATLLAAESKEGCEKAAMGAAAGLECKLLNGGDVATIADRLSALGAVQEALVSSNPGHRS